MYPATIIACIKPRLPKLPPRKVVRRILTSTITESCPESIFFVSCSGRQYYGGIVGEYNLEGVQIRRDTQFGQVGERKPMTETSTPILWSFPINFGENRVIK